MSSVSDCNQEYSYKEGVPYVINPFKRPYVWTFRYNWNCPDGLYYDPENGDIYDVNSSSQYVNYIGQLRLNKKGTN